MTGMSSEAVREARNRIATARTKGIRAEDITSDGVIIDAFSENRELTITKENGKFIAVEEEPVSGANRSMEIDVISTSILDGYTVVGAKSSAEAVYSMIARGVMFNII